MAAYENLQPVICNIQEHRCAGFQIMCMKGDTISNIHVSELLWIDRRRVTELMQQLKDTRDSHAVVDRASRPSSSVSKARTLDFIRRVSDIFKHDPNRSIRDISWEMDVYHVTLLACVIEDVLKKSLDWLAANTYDFIPKIKWFVSSPNLNPIGYFFGG